MPIAWMLSDCDGVILDSEVVAEAIMREVLQRAFRALDSTAKIRDMVRRRL